MKAAGKEKASGFAAAILREGENMRKEKQRASRKPVPRRYNRRRFEGGNAERIKTISKLHVSSLSPSSPPPLPPPHTRPFRASALHCMYAPFWNLAAVASALLPACIKIASGAVNSIGTFRASAVCRGV